MSSDQSSDGLRLSKEAKLGILLAGVAVVLLILARVPNSLGPFVWGAILAYVLSPAVDWVEARTRLRRAWVVALLYLIGMAVAVWASTAVIPLLVKQASDLLADLPRILTAPINQLAFIEEWLAERGLEDYGLTIDPQMLVDQAVRSVQDLAGYVTRHAIPAVFNVIGGLFQVILCLIVAFYLLKASPMFPTRLVRLIPPLGRSEALGLIRDIDDVLSAYIRGQLIVIGIMALATFVALSILRVRYALVLALLTGVLEVIPSFGPFTAGGIAVSVALFQPNPPFGWSNLTLALAVVIVYVVLQQLENQLLLPNLLGHAVNLHPLVVLFVLFVGSRLAGLTGAVIAVPATAVLKIVAIYLHGKIWDDHTEEADHVPAMVDTVPAEPSSAPGETA